MMFPRHAFPALAFVLTVLPAVVECGRQQYDVRKIIEAFKDPREDLTILCAHRGLRWNGTAENSRDSYFRAAEAGIECVETDIWLSQDGQLPMVHDSGLGRTTDVGETDKKSNYNPFTGKGFNPKVKSMPWFGGIELLHLRDEQGRTRQEQVPTLVDMIHMIRDNNLNVVLELDFKDIDAVEPAYWAIKNLKNGAGVPAVEWCIFKLQSVWWQNSTSLEALPWVQDAFVTFGKFAYIPVYDPSYASKFDVLASQRSFASTNYTISWEIENQCDGCNLQPMLDAKSSLPIKTSGIFYSPGDFVKPEHGRNFDTANYTLPRDLSVNNTHYVYQDDAAPRTYDSLVKAANTTLDGHDHRVDWAFLLKQGHKWIITDTSDEWADRLAKEGRRNISSMLQDGANTTDKTWYKRG